jgi:hypothetical protein
MLSSESSVVHISPCSLRRAYEAIPEYSAISLVRDMHLLSGAYEACKLILNTGMFGPRISRQGFLKKLRPCFYGDFFYVTVTFRIA